MKQIGLIIGCNFMPDDNIIQMAAKALLDAGHDIAEFDVSAMKVNRSDLTMEQARTAYSQAPLARELTDPVLECHRLKIAGNILIVVYPQSPKFAEAEKLTGTLSDW